jgi:hypothetical protein
MGLLAAFAVLALAPQDPTPSPAPRPTAVLAAQEERGEAAEPGVLAQLAQGDDAAIAARAAWALGRTKGADSLAALHAVAKDSSHAEARLQAMHALAGRAQPDSQMIAVAGLLDADARVRAEAARLAGATKLTAAAKALVAMVGIAAKQGAAATAPDVPAALLALCDLRAADSVLAAAQALDGARLGSAGPALHYLCQELVPTLPRPAQLTTLQTLVAHSEPDVRRFAMTQLASLRDVTALPWVQARIAAEQGDLQTLAQQACAVIGAPPASDDPLVQGERNARAIAWRAASWWRHSDDTDKAIVVGAPCAVLTLVFVGMVLGRRRRAAAAAAAASYDDAAYAEGEVPAEATDEAYAEGEASAEATDEAYADGEAPAEEAADGTYADGEVASDEAYAEGDDQAADATEPAYAEVGADDATSDRATADDDSWTGDAQPPR